MSVDLDVDLESWLAGGKEIPCEMKHTSLLGGSFPCQLSSTWVGYFSRACGCLPLRVTCLLCDQCHNEVTTNGADCEACHGNVEVLWLERTRD